MPQKNNFEVSHEAIPDFDFESPVEHAGDAGADFLLYMADYFPLGESTIIVRDLNNNDKYILPIIVTEDGANKKAKFKYNTIYNK